MQRFWIGPVLLVALGCAAPQPEPVVDLPAERNALMQADAALFDSHRDLDRFASFWAEGALFMPDDAPLARGPEALRDSWEQLLGLPGFHLEWSATEAHVADAADLGYTVGRYELTVEQDGVPMVTVGKYVTTWRRQDDGSWKVVVDCFNADGPPAPA